jgi:phage terminase small subunit
MTDPAHPATPARRPPRLNPKQRAFVAEYLIDLNATQAAIRAGYKENAANRAGWRLLRLTQVEAAVAEAMAARAERTRVSLDRVIEEYARLAFTDMRAFTEWGPEGMRLRPHSALSDADAAAVREVTDGGRTGKPRIRLHDKRAALDALARHLGLFGTRPGPVQRYPLGYDMRTPAQDRARAALRRAIAKVIAQRGEKKAEQNDD